MTKPFAIAGLAALLFTVSSTTAFSQQRLQSSAQQTTAPLEVLLQATPQQAQAEEGGETQKNLETKTYRIAEMRSGWRRAHPKYLGGTLTLGENDAAFVGEGISRANFKTPYAAISDVKVYIAQGGGMVRVEQPRIWAEFRIGKDKRMFHSVSAQTTIDIAVEVMNRIGQENFVYQEPLFREEWETANFLEEVRIRPTCGEKKPQLRLTKEGIYVEGSEEAIPYSDVSVYTRFKQMNPLYAPMPVSSITLPSPFGSCDIGTTTFYEVAYRIAQSK